MKVMLYFSDFVCIESVDAVQFDCCILAEGLLGLELLEERYLLLSLLGVFSTFLLVFVR